jgi:hypothetical protein
LEEEKVLDLTWNNCEFRSKLIITETEYLKDLEPKIGTSAGIIHFLV